MSLSVSAIYKSVIANVVNAVRHSFETEGSDVVLDLQEKWEDKLNRSGVLLDEEPPDDWLPLLQGTPDAVSQNLEQANATLLPSTELKTDEPQPSVTNPPGKRIKTESGTPSEIKSHSSINSEELGSDLDETDEDPDTSNIVLCQYEKVSRIKNKRKVILKDGVMHLEGRDFLFNRALGEFDF